VHRRRAPGQRWQDPGAARLPTPLQRPPPSWPRLRCRTPPAARRRARHDAPQKCGGGKHRRSRCGCCPARTARCCVATSRRGRPSLGTPHPLRRPAAGGRRPAPLFRSAAVPHRPVRPPHATPGRVSGQARSGAPMRLLRAAAAARGRRSCVVHLARGCPMACGPPPRVGGAARRGAPPLVDARRATEVPPAPSPSWCALKEAGRLVEHPIGQVGSHRQAPAQTRRKAMRPPTRPPIRPLPRRGGGRLAGGVDSARPPDGHIDVLHQAAVAGVRHHYARLSGSNRDEAQHCHGPDFGDVHTRANR